MTKDTKLCILILYGFILFSIVFGVLRYTLSGIKGFTLFPVADKYKVYYGLDSKHQPLTSFVTPTSKELNSWIYEQGNGDTNFSNKADIFLTASNKSKLDPVYLVAHSATESAWGKADLNKNNYFGIGAYNNSEFKSARTFSDGLKNGITEGSLWISKNYVNKGQNTITKFEYPTVDKTHIYAQLDDGSPNLSWLKSVSSIMNTAPWRTRYNAIGREGCNIF